MALAAILAKLVLMRILMTTGTIIICHAAELLEFLPFSSVYFVAFYTFHIPVFSGKLKFRIIMTEFRCRVKCLCCMAVQAFRGERPEMVIIVTV
jgi:hypothetical protein